MVAKTEPVMLWTIAATTPGSAASGLKNLADIAEAKPDCWLPISMATVRLYDCGMPISLPPRYPSTYPMTLCSNTAIIRTNPTCAKRSPAPATIGNITAQIPTMDTHGRIGVIRVIKLSKK